jgi:hypothetical protein
MSDMGIFAPPFVWIDEANRFLSRIDDIAQFINGTVRMREARGWTSALVLDATMRGGDVKEIPITPGSELIRLEPVPMVFAVAIVSRKGTVAEID